MARSLAIRGATIVSLDPQIGTIDKGLLIEPSYDYEKLLTKNRKAKSLNVCLATKTVPHEVEFMNYDMLGGIKGNHYQKNKMAFALTNFTSDLRFAQYL